MNMIKKSLFDYNFDILLYWVSKGIDGFRCDMQHQESRISHPGLVFIEEVYEPSQYRNFISIGFNYCDGSSSYIEY